MGREYKGYMKPVKLNCVKKLRVFKGMFQKNVAKEIGMTLSVYRDLEDNRRAIRYLESKKLAELFDINENQLYED